MPRSRSRGFALVIVLWSVVLLALLGARLTGTAREQLRIASGMRDHARAEAAADGAMRQAMFLLLGGGRPGGGATPLRVQIDGVAAEIVTEDEAGKINPNTASKDVMRGLFIAVGVDPPRAARLAGQVADWRIRNIESLLGGPKIDQYRDRGLPYRSADRAFASLDELALLADMTPEIFTRVRPWLSVYHEGGVTDPTAASPASTAASDARLSGAAASGPGFVSRNVIVRITAVAALPGRARFVRSAVVRVRADSAPETSGGPHLIEILTWE